MSLSFVIYSINKTYVYNLVSNSDDYYVDGQITFKGNEFLFIINELKFVDKKIKTIVIKDYEYKITSGEIFMYGYGHDPISENEDKEITIKQFEEKFYINFNGEIKMKELLKNNAVVTITFTDITDSTITKEIEVAIYKKK